MRILPSALKPINEVLQSLASGPSMNLGVPPLKVSSPESTRTSQLQLLKHASGDICVLTLAADLEASEALG